MEQKELFQNLLDFAIDQLSYEEIHSFGSPEEFHKWVEKNFIPIPKAKLITGHEYQGICRNANKAIWNGLVFVYERHKFGSSYLEEINHYEDDDGYDLFVPIESKIKLA